jgi:predicted metal-dependent hydrolase
MNIEEKNAAMKLEKLCPIPLNLAWHENRTSFFSCRRERTKIHLRLHRLFMKAPSPVLEAVVGYALKGDKKAGTIVRQMAHLYFTQKQIEPDALESKGKIFDLDEILSRIKQIYFPDLKVAIGWSNHSRVGSFKCITFGCYDKHRNQIRINPLLDDADVPLYFLDFLVYHEALHAICPSRIDARGAVHSHTREFRALEKKFSEYRLAKEWEKKSLAFFKSRRFRYGRT